MRLVWGPIHFAQSLVEAIPGWVFGLLAIAVFGVLLIVIPLLRFRHQSYLDNGGRFGSNSFDTMIAVSLKAENRDDEAAVHIARRELRKLLVEVDLRIEAMNGRGTLSSDDARVLRSRLDELADDNGLLVPFNARDVTAPGALVLGLAGSGVALKVVNEQLTRLDENATVEDVSWGELIGNAIAEGEQRARGEDEQVVDWAGEGPGGVAPGAAANGEDREANVAAGKPAAGKNRRPRPAEPEAAAKGNPVGK